MKWHISKDERLPYFVIVLDGGFELRDLESCYREMLAHEKWKKGANILWDVTRCQMDHLTEHTMRDIAAMTSRYAEARGRGHAAWLVSRDIDFGVSRMFQMVNDDKIAYYFRVFRDRTDAESWLRGEGE